jgi:hypothetical protein
VSNIDNEKVTLENPGGRCVGYRNNPLSTFVGFVSPGHGTH